MKKLMLTTAVMAVLGLPVVAQDGMFRNEMTAGSVRASDLIGARIYASEAAVDADEYSGVQEGWDDIGEINDVIVGREGQVEAVLVDIGGFLGMGERQVAVDMAALRFVSDASTADNADDWFLVMNADRGTLEGAPEWMMTGTDAAATGTAADATATDMAATDGMAADPATTTEGADQTATTEGEMADPDAAVANTDGAMAEGTSANGLTRDGYTAVAGTDLTADMLKGATAYDSQDANVGEVGDLILEENGQVKQIVIDVGGFLGMGEKPVALALDQVEILRQTEGGAVRVYVSLTKEELEALPDHKM
jgi:PRC-barrel domain